MHRELNFAVRVTASAHDADTPALIEGAVHDLLDGSLYVGKVRERDLPGSGHVRVEVTDFAQHCLEEPD